MTFAPQLGKVGKQTRTLMVHQKNIEGKSVFYIPPRKSLSMNPTRIFNTVTAFLSLLCLLASAFSCRMKSVQPDASALEITSLRHQAGEGQQGIITQAELQSDVMSFADRYAVIIGQAFDDFEAQSPTTRARYTVLRDAAYSTWAAFTIAAEPNPEVALLDMVVLTMLGRLVYEEHWRKEFGEPAEAMISAFRKLEADVWQIAERVMPLEQQQELRGLIRQWRQNHPDHYRFSFLRFEEFG
jgi:hypothetical protein